MVNVIYSGNDKYFNQIVLSLLSMVNHTKSDLNVFIMTLDCETKKGKYYSITDQQVAWIDGVLKTYNKNNKVTLLHMDELYKKHMNNNKNKNSVYTPYTLLRLLAHHLDNIPDKIIYIDTDTMIYNDIQELFDIELVDEEYAAVQDAVGHKFFGKNYINAGVLLLNVKRIKETGLFDKCIDYIMNKRSFMPDQDAINYRRTKFKLIPNKFNEQRDVKKDTVIKHFCKIPIWFPIIHTVNIKQTNRQGVHEVLKIFEFDDIFEKYDELVKSAPQELLL